MAEKTIIPGMPAPQAPATGTIYPGIPTPSPGPKRPNSKPIMGFLYSVSRTPFGEFWPLYIGPNTIGRGTNNSVRLCEASVSESHATIVIRKMQKQGSNDGILVFIQDERSMCGTLLNGDSLGFNPEECKNGDVITVGPNYELYLIIVDSDALGLQTKANFQDTSSAVPAANGGLIGLQTDGLPKGTIVGDPGIGLDQPGGTNPFDTRKATIYMQKK